MRYLSCLCFTLVALFGLSGAARAQNDRPDMCSVPGIIFASCVPEERLFGAVVIAVPGWNGSCAESFNTGANNLLNIMQTEHFFDIDCFDFDAHFTSLQTSADLLDSRLADLHRAGYREVAFLTHSTGGVLVLEMLANQMQRAMGFADPADPRRAMLFRRGDRLRLAGLYTFAIPINGVRDTVCLSGQIANALRGVSPAVLPFLCTDSEYLRELKDRLRRLGDSVDALPADERGLYRFSWFILQGRGEDWVVEDVLPMHNWYPGFADVNFIDTAEPHLETVSDNGVRGYPTYSGAIMSDKSKLLFRLLPRLDSHFGVVAVATRDHDRRQRHIVNGVVDYASVPNLFNEGTDAVSSLIVTLLNRQFTRSPTFDDFAVARFENLLGGAQDVAGLAHTVTFADFLLDELDRGLTAPTDLDPEGFGGGSWRATRHLVGTVMSMFTIVREAIDADATLERFLVFSGGKPRFETRVASVLERFSAVPDDETRRLALAAYQTFAMLAEEDSIRLAGFVDTVRTFAFDNRALLSGDGKSGVVAVFEALSARSPDLNQQVVAAWTTPVEWLGDQAPLWAAYLNRGQLDGLIADPTIPPRLRSNFLGTVVAYNGFQGNSRAMALDAVKEFGPLVSDQPVAAQFDNARILYDAAGESGDYLVRRQTDNLLGDYGFTPEMLELQ